MRVPVFIAWVFVLLAGCTAPAPRPADSISDWTSYNRDLAGHRFSPLAQIRAANAGKLRRLCVAPLAETGALQAGILEIGGVLYVTTAHDTYAIDAATCALRWTNVHAIAGPEPNPVDRGVAWDGGTRLIRGTPDAHLIAIDLRDGHTLWDVAPGNGAHGEFLSSAPIVWNGFVYIGTAGGSWGASGRMMAFNLTDGSLRWTFHTIAPGSGRLVGGGLWTSYALDATTRELFISVGNPAPDFAPAYRPGDNLYTDSLVALDPLDGHLKWYYQAVRADEHDWDLASPADLVTLGALRLAVVAGKDGYVYGVDRSTHRLRWRTPEVRMQNVDRPATPQGTRVCPGALGGAEWNGTAYDERNHLLLTPMDDWCGTFKLEAVRRQPGGLFQGGTFIRDPYEQARGVLTATDPRTGAVVWQYRSATPMVAGVTPTAGDITFTGDLAGNVLVFETRTGRVLYRDLTQGGIAGGVITYALDGRQYVALTSGNISRFTWGPHGRPTIVIYSL
jgi:glucose dehydrogenase